MIQQKHQRRVLSLFTGAGGLDLGLEAAGFTTRLCVEIDDDARSTLMANRPAWKVATPGDIHAYQAADLLSQGGLKTREVELLAGGPPCQPFSKSGYWVSGDSQRLLDPRAATLRAYLQVVSAALPKVILIENVRGLTFDGKDEGLRLLHDGLRRINRKHSTAYELVVVHMNAADYGVPQFRERVFLIAHRDGLSFERPTPTHGSGAGLLPYRTTWDAIGDLVALGNADETLSVTGKWAKLLPSIPEGENYLWHTPNAGGEPLFGWRTKFWSFLLKLAKDRPSWTIQAAPGPATGPFHWASRMLSAREMCRLQTFPDSYTIIGNHRSAQRQIGNAVPCALAELIGLELRRQFFGETRLRAAPTLIPKTRPSRPDPEITLGVDPEYDPLRGNHKPHPGVGLGPSARLRKKAPNARQRA